MRAIALTVALLLCAAAVSATCTAPFTSNSTSGSCDACALAYVYGPQCTSVCSNVAYITQTQPLFNGSTTQFVGYDTAAYELGRAFTPVVPGRIPKLWYLDTEMGAFAITLWDGNGQALFTGSTNPGGTNSYQSVTVSPAAVVSVGVTYVVSLSCSGGSLATASGNVPPVATNYLTSAGQGTYNTQFGQWPAPGNVYGEYVGVDITFAPGTAAVPYAYALHDGCNAGYYGDGLPACVAPFARNSSTGACNACSPAQGAVYGSNCTTACPKAVQGLRSQALQNGQSFAGVGNFQSSTYETGLGFVAVVNGAVPQLWYLSGQPGVTAIRLWLPGGTVAASSSISSGSGSQVWTSITLGTSIAITAGGFYMVSVTVAANSLFWYGTPAAVVNPYFSSGSSQYYSNAGVYPTNPTGTMMPMDITFIPSQLFFLPTGYACASGYYGSGKLLCLAPFTQNTTTGLCDACAQHGVYGSACTSVCAHAVSNGTVPYPYTCADGYYGSGATGCLAPFAKNTTSQNCDACLSSTVYGTNCTRNCTTAPNSVCNAGYYGNGGFRCTVPYALNATLNNCQACASSTVYGSNCSTVCVSPPHGACNNTGYFGTGAIACQLPYAYNFTTGDCSACASSATVYGASCAPCNPPTHSVCASPGYFGVGGFQCAPPYTLNVTTGDCSACASPTAVGVNCTACGNPTHSTCIGAGYFGSGNWACNAPFALNSALGNCTACLHPGYFGTNCSALCAWATPAVHLSNAIASGLDAGGNGINVFAGPVYAANVSVAHQCELGNVLYQRSSGGTVDGVRLYAVNTTGATLLYAHLTVASGLTIAYGGFQSSAKVASAQASVSPNVTGWVFAPFQPPVRLQTGSVYVVSVAYPLGGYAYTLSSIVSGGLVQYLFDAPGLGLSVYDSVESGFGANVLDASGYAPPVLGPAPVVDGLANPTWLIDFAYTSDPVFPPAVGCNDGYSGNGTVTCQAPFAYNASSNYCDACLPGYYSSSCSACPVGVQHLVCPTGQYYGTLSCLQPYASDPPTGSCAACASPTASGTNCTQCAAPPNSNATGYGYANTCGFQCTAPFVFNASSNDCTACASPTVFGATCSSPCNTPANAVCSSGFYGTGVITCLAPFAANASTGDCRACQPGFFGSTCTACASLPHTTCADGYSNTGQLSCVPPLTNATGTCDCPTNDPNFSGTGPGCNNTCPNCPFATAICSGGLNSTTGTCICRSGFVRPMGMRAMLCDCPFGTFGADCSHNCTACGVNQVCPGGYQDSGQCRCQAGFSNSTGVDGGVSDPAAACTCSDPLAYGSACQFSCPVAGCQANAHCSSGLHGSGCMCNARFAATGINGACGCANPLAYGPSCSQTCPQPLPPNTLCSAGVSGTGLYCKTSAFAPIDGNVTNGCDCAQASAYGSDCLQSCAASCTAASYSTCSSGYQGVGCTCMAGGAFLNNASSACDCSDPLAYGSACEDVCPSVLPPNTRCSAGLRGLGVVCGTAYFQPLVNSSTGGCGCIADRYSPDCSRVCDTGCTNDPTQVCSLGTAGVGCRCAPNAQFNVSDSSCHSCRSGFFGPSCEPCPVFSDNRAVCVDGYGGSGGYTCPSPWASDGQGGCSTCDAGLYGSDCMGNCSVCPPNYACDEGVQGSGCIQNTVLVNSSTLVCSESYFVPSQYGIIPNGCDCPWPAYGPTCNSSCHWTCTASNMQQCFAGFEGWGCACIDTNLYTMTPAGTCDCADAQVFGPACAQPCSSCDPVQETCTTGLAGGCQRRCSAGQQYNVTAQACDCIDATAFGPDCSSQCACNATLCDRGINGTGVCTPVVVVVVVVPPSVPPPPQQNSSTQAIVAGVAAQLIAGIQNATQAASNANTTTPSVGLTTAQFTSVTLVVTGTTAGTLVIGSLAMSVLAALL